MLGLIRRILGAWLGVDDLEHRLRAAERDIGELDHCIEEMADGQSVVFEVREDEATDLVDYFGNPKVTPEA